MRSRTLFRSILMGLVMMFVWWRPAMADGGHARIIRLSLVQGDVRFARDVHGDPLTSDKAVWEGATLNLPIRQGYVLATDQGRAEVEFENGAMGFLAENSVLEFYDLSLEDGAKTTRLVLRQGTASFYVNPGGGDYFSVTGGDFTVEADGRAGFRLDNFDDGSVVDVNRGRVNVVRKKQTTALVKGQSLSMRADDKDSTSIARLPDSDDFDRWVSKREDAVTSATAAGGQYVNSMYYSSGIADLYTYGSWYPVSGYGNCWRPYGVGLGWSPFSAGGWFSDPAYGWSFIGSQPWGWLPYHFGGWVFDPVFGWLWSPGLGFGAGFGGFVPFRPVTGVFVRSRTGLLGFVPAHPLDARGKEPINMAKGVFPVTGGTVSQQAIASASAGENWKTMKAPPRESLTNTAVATSAAPTRVSRTILSGAGGARVVTVGRNSSIIYDAHEHKFVNGAGAAQSALAKGNERSDGAARNLDAGQRNVPEGSVPVRSEAAAKGGPVPTATARSVAPPARVMTPPPARAGSGAGGGFGGGWGQSGGSRGSSGSAGGAGRSSGSSAGASHPSVGGPSGGGRPH
jgi:hypothetical protein